MNATLLKHAVLICLLAVAPALSYAAETDKSRDELEKTLAQTRQELNEAARKVAELSRELAAMNMENRVFVHGFGGREPHGRLGIMINGEADGKVDGVSVVGVTPGGPADEAGIKSGDLLLAINGKPLAAASGEAAVENLMAQLRTIQPEQQVTLRYRRDGKTAETKVTAEAFAFPPLAWHDDGENFAVTLPPRLPEHGMTAVFKHFLSGWGDMELVNLSPALGEYFGTDKGVLVVRAPADDALQLKDGDVILKIGEREPENPVHAMRILRSYQPGESLQLTIMRDQDEMELTITLPAAEPAAMRVFPERLEKTLRVARRL